MDALLVLPQSRLPPVGLAAVRTNMRLGMLAPPVGHQVLEADEALPAGLAIVDLVTLAVPLECFRVERYLPAIWAPKSISSTALLRCLGWRSSRGRLRIGTRSAMHGAIVQLQSGPLAETLPARHAAQALVDLRMSGQLLASSERLGAAGNAACEEPRVLEAVLRNMPCEVGVPLVGPAAPWYCATKKPHLRVQARMLVIPCARGEGLPTVTSPLASSRRPRRRRRRRRPSVGQGCLRELRFGHAVRRLMPGTPGRA
mmetsp:Transcript_9614/g.21513  ORF Transcript_9614/g.21513 Transcript_9614/m.21513 type:complete len:257 (+) Transcript_9614:541-1311(+)